jgi:hypothetical protein
MATNGTRTQTTPANPTTNAAFEQQKLPQRTAAAVSDAGNSARKPSGFGLPCSKCRTYYPADLDRCPICNHNERVSPAVPKIPPKSVQAASAPVPTSAALEKERDEFLKQFKAQAGAAVPEAPGAMNAACTAAGHHSSESESAEVCKACYERLQERLDICEAALHMDLKEAAQIIYDAVWADPSDPNKTYQNAAHALLAELRKRAGVNSLKGPFQPLAD